MNPGLPVVRALRRGRRGASLVAAFTATLLLGACQGDNLFSGDSPEALPRVTRVSGPEEALAGDTISVRVDASAVREITRMDLSMRGAIARDTTIVVEPTTPQLSQAVAIPIPTALPDTILVVSATVTDKVGRISGALADTIIAVGPPAVLAVTGPDSARLSNPVDIRILARGGRRISQLALQVSGAFSLDSVIAVSPPSTNVDRTVRLQLPAVVQDTLVRVNVVAQDESGLISPVNGLFIPVSIDPPTLELTAPDTVRPGGTLDLELHGHALRQVAQFKVELSGAVYADSLVAVVPTQIDVTQHVTMHLPGDIQDSTLVVRAQAFDVGGAVSAPAVDTVHVRLGAPVILSLMVPDSTKPNRLVDVRVIARGTRPLSLISIRFRGATDADANFTVTPQRTDVTQDASTFIPEVVNDTLLVVNATATDVSGDVSAIASDTIRVNDVTPPNVLAGVSPVSVGSGRSVNIRITASDNVGLRNLGYAVVTPAGDTVGVSPFLVNATGLSRDTTFNFLVPTSLLPGSYHVLGIATDGANLRGLSTPVSLAVVDSGVPYVQIQSPATGATFPLDDSLQVRVQVSDATGIRSVSIKGIAIRGDSLSDSQVVVRYAERTINFPQPPSTTLPTDTLLIRYLRPVSDSTSEPVKIVVAATDSVGNVGTDTVDVSVGGPRVEIRTPATGSQVLAGSTLLLQAFAVDRASGIDSMKVFVTGVQNQTLVWRNLASPDSVKKDTTLVVADTVGNVTITASAWNRRGVAGNTATPVLVTISRTAQPDTAKPQVALQINTASRVELDDSIQVLVTALDQGSSGLKRVGVVAIAIPDTSSVPPDTLFLDSTFATGRTGTLQRPFYFRLADFPYHETSALRLPRKFTLQIHAFAVDTVGNCGASTKTTLSTSSCTAIPVGATEYYVATGETGQSTVVTAVAGSSVLLPSGGTIADAVVDPVNQRLYLSNYSHNKIDVLRLTDSTFQAPVQVGSQPWGLALNNGGDTLMVANSGGTNISFVPVNTLTEDGSRRLLTPNNVLFDVHISLSLGIIRYTVLFHDFSDRPQFLAEDQNGVLLYSTVPTGSAPDGTIRWVDPNPDPGTVGENAEVHILFNQRAIAAGDGLALANLDSIQVVRPSTSNDQINLFDHLPGHPSTVIQSGFYDDVQAALTALRAAGSDVLDYPGSWIDANIGLSDTTYVAASGDRRVIGFGEGGVGPAGRIMLWDAATRDVSDEISVQDLVNNAFERVLGLGLDQNGGIGVARGTQATYFFSNDVNQEGDLRLQGVFADGVQGGNGGAALHPDHVYSGGSTANTLAFIATANQTIKIVDTFHFFQRGEIPIRDNIVGQLRAALPLASDNVGFAPADPDYTIVKLYGVTERGAVVIVNVRNKDLTS